MQWNPLNQFNRNSYKLFVTPLHNIFFGTLTVVYNKQNYNSLVNVCATPDLKNRINIIGTKNIFNRIKPFPEGEMWLSQRGNILRSTETLERTVSFRSKV